MSTDYNPFQSPAAPFQPGGGGTAWPIIPFQSGHQRATITIALLAAAALMCAARSITAYVNYTSLVTLPDGRLALGGAAAAIAAGTMMLFVAAMIVGVATIVAFSMWTHRAARNLPALGARRLQYTPGWAVGWFFIPLANLVMPYLVGAEIWRESDPAQRGEGGKTTSPLVACWWFAYLAHSVLPVFVGAVLGGIIGAVAGSHSNGDPQQVALAINHYQATYSLIAVAGQAVGVLAAILAILYVRRVDANQEAKFGSIHGEGFTA